MKDWLKHLTLALLIAVVALACTSKARAQGIANQGIANIELYPGINQAVAETIAQENEKPTVAKMVARQTVGLVETADDEVPLASSSRLWDCDKYEAVSVNAWGVSHHTGDRTGKRKMQEKNTGPGIVYTCNNLSVGFDQMRNSNNGRARLLSVFLSTDNLELGPVFVRASVGGAKVEYGHPRYGITVSDKTAIAFACAGFVALRRLSVCGAPVPKVAGDPAYIGWLNYVVYFK